MPDPPPVQKSTLPLNKSGLNTSNDDAGFRGVAAFVDILGTEVFELMFETEGSKGNFESEQLK
jgi:hypothetical protein